MRIFSHDSDMTDNLPLDGQINLIEKIASEYDEYIGMGFNYCPSQIVYKIQSRDEDLSVIRKARVAALNDFHKPIRKVAFDTRRVDQKTQRNPRANLQYWHRTDAFIDSEDEGKLSRFARLMRILDDIKKQFGTEPEWFESYARVLYDNVHRILRIKQADLDIFKPQLSYLEQLLDARYRLSMEDLQSLSNDMLRERILSKDESLLKRGFYLKETGLVSKGDEKQQQKTTNGNVELSDNLAKAIFGTFRQPGERSVERTVTITIRDSVVD